MPDMEYDEWLEQVENIIEGACGMDLDSLAGDLMSYDAWEAGTSPQTFAREDVVEGVREMWGPERARYIRGLL